MQLQLDADGFQELKQILETGIKFAMITVVQNGMLALMKRVETCKQGTITLSNDEIEFLVAAMSSRAPFVRSPVYGHELSEYPEFIQWEKIRHQVTAALH